MYDAAYNFQGGQLCEDPMPRTIRIAVRVYVDGHFEQKNEGICQLQAIAVGLSDEPFVYCVSEYHGSGRLGECCWQFPAEGLKERILFSAPNMGGKIR